MSESPIKTIGDFIQYAKAHPGMTYGSPGMYTPAHMAVHMLGVLTRERPMFKGTDLNLGEPLFPNP